MGVGDAIDAAISSMAGMEPICCSQVDAESLECTGRRWHQVIGRTATGKRRGTGELRIAVPLYSIARERRPQRERVGGVPTYIPVKVTMHRQPGVAVPAGLWRYTLVLASRRY